MSSDEFLKMGLVVIIRLLFDARSLELASASACWPAEVGRNPIRPMSAPRRAIFWSEWITQAQHRLRPTIWRPAWSRSWLGRWIPLQRSCAMAHGSTRSCC